jgi:hypothetical protein
MKKWFVWVIAVACLAAGCTKKYSSVEEYAQAMKSVQKSHKSYTLEIETLSFLADSYSRVYVKNNLWKYDQSANHGRDYFHTVLFDGTDVVGYGQRGGQWATLISTPEKQQEKSNDNMLNVPGELFDWYMPLRGSASFVNNNARMNGFECRLIKQGDSYEVCVSDTLGIAVYSKFKFGENEEIVKNVVKVDTTELPDSTFVLPSNKQKVTLEKMLEEMKKGNF